MTSIIESRSDFGLSLRTLRKQRGLSLRGLQELSGVNYTVISSFERGERAVGAESAGRLADGLGLAAGERDPFLFQAAGTRRKDRLVGYARSLEPEILNFLPMMLAAAGINLGNIKRSEVRSTLPRGSDSPHILSRLQKAYNRVVDALSGRAEGDFLFVDGGGQRLLCTLLMVPTG